jgi:DNA polymerase-1
MLDAYERELALVRIKLKMERHGVNTAHKRIKRDLPKYHKAAADCHAKIIKRLKITPAYEAECPKGFFNLNSNDQLADALENAGLVTEWYLTDKGNRSTSAENLRAVIKDKKFMQTWEIYAVLQTYLSTFLQPWHDMGASNDGFIFPTFNQVRTEQEHGDFKSRGTKTGRPSVSKPNFNNIPANVEDSKNAKVLKAVYDFLQGYNLNFVGLRDYIVPTPGNWFVGRDYQQQEMRVLAHYEDGALLRSYLSNPDLDIHDAVRLLIRDMIGVNLPRKAVKTIAFAIMYGLGLPSLAERLDVTYNEAKEIKAAYLRALPGLESLNKGLKALDHTDAPLFTIGGRQYFTEPASMVNGSMRTYGYKNLNLLIQGGSADITKEAMLIFDSLDPKGNLVLQVYDEMVVDTPDHKHDMPLLRFAMETSFQESLDLPMPTDGEYSRKSWGRMTNYREKKKWDY